MNEKLEDSLGFVKRTCELYIKSASNLIGSDIIANKINEALDTIKQALLELNANPNEALKYVNGKIADLEDDLQHYTMVEKDKCKEFYIREDLKQFTNIQQALLKAQEQEKENAELLQALALFKQKLEDTDNIKAATTMMKQLDTNIKLETENAEYKEVLSVIKNIIKFRDDLISILNFDTYEEYCKHSCEYGYELTQQKYKLLNKLLKEVLEYDN